jgi:hypothetical protein
MESKNVQKTRFSAGLKTKSLYMVIEKMFKTHVEEFRDFTNFLSINKNNNVVLKTMMDRLIGRPLDFSNLDIYKCPKMDSTRLSFLGSLKNNFVYYKIIFKAYVVRELRGFEVLFFRKKPKNP